MESAIWSPDVLGPFDWRPNHMGRRFATGALFAQYRARIAQDCSISVDFADGSTRLAPLCDVELRLTGKGRYLELDQPAPSPECSTMLARGTPIRFARAGGDAFGASYYEYTIEAGPDAGTSIWRVESAWGGPTFPVEALLRPDDAPIFNDLLAGERLIADLMEIADEARAAIAAGRLLPGEAELAAAWDNRQGINRRSHRRGRRLLGWFAVHSAMR